MSHDTRNRAKNLRPAKRRNRRQLSLFAPERQQLKSDLSSRRRPPSSDPRWWFSWQPPTVGEFKAMLAEDSTEGAK
jgi:hypothetical protein